MTASNEAVTSEISAFNDRLVQDTTKTKKVIKQSMFNQFEDMKRDSNSKESVKEESVWVGFTKKKR